MSILEAKALRKRYQFGKHTVDALAEVDFWLRRASLSPSWALQGVANLLYCTCLAVWINPPAGK